MVVGMLAGGANAVAAPIPEGPEAGSVPSFIGSPAQPSPVAAPPVREHPFMAANGRSNLHNDAYQTDTYTWSGPLGTNMERLSTFMGSECASITFDQQGRLVVICVGLDGPRLVMFDPQTIEPITAFPLPPRVPNTGSTNPFTDFSGGGYFYLDNNDRAVIPTTTRHIWVIAESSGQTGPEFALERDYDVSGVVPSETGSSRRSRIGPAGSGSYRAAES
jgi:hypothetical protein